MLTGLPLTVRRYRDALQTMPWLSLAGYGLLILLYGAIFSLLLPAAWQRSFTRCVMIAPIFLLAAKDLACFPLSVRRLKTAKAQGATWRRCVAALTPPEFPAFLRLERAMWRGFLSWLLRRPQPVRPAGTALGYLERGAYGTVICCALLVLCVELPLDVFIASVLAKTRSQAHLLHLGFGVVAAYSFVWVLGDRWHVMTRRHHVLTATTLELDIGARGSGSIARSAIASCERLSESRANWCKRHGVAVHATRKLTPFDAPNAVLRLIAGCDVRLTLLQQACGGDGPIFLYLDRPELLSAELNQRNNDSETL